MHREPAELLRLHAIDHRGELRQVVGRVTAGAVPQCDARAAVAGRREAEFQRAGDRQAQHLQVTFVDPGKTLRLVGGLGPLQGMGLHGALEFRLAAAGDGRTRITLWYRAGGYTPDDLAKFAPEVDRVQAQQLGGLATHLGGDVTDATPAGSATGD